jgi:acetolactate synthase I/II/III large subunit
MPAGRVLRPAVKELIPVEETRFVRRTLAPRLHGSNLGAARPGPMPSTCPRMCVTASTISSPRISRSTRRPCTGPVHPAQHYLRRAERPLLLVGGGAGRASGIGGISGAQVVHTMSDRGDISCTHALSAGLFGRYSRIANELIFNRAIAKAKDCPTLDSCGAPNIVSRVRIIQGELKPPPRCGF